MTERRRDPRISLSRSVKLRCDQTGARYLAGLTRDISAGGALLQLDYPSRLTTGQRVQIGVVRYPQQPLLRHQELMEAVIVRSFGHGVTQHVAVAFKNKQALALAS
jgi:c-di-GMP-binding flagellar brake protein YcgR